MEDLTLVELEAKLNNFKKNRALIETTEIRIRTYEDLLKNNKDDRLNLIFESSEAVELGMPKPKGKISKPVEMALIKKEISREKVREWIDNDKNRILIPKLELQQIESAMKALNEEEVYIIELKYFNKWNWNAIVSEFNARFRNVYNTYISESGIRKIKKKSLETLCEILNNFYKSIR